MLFASNLRTRLARSDAGTRLERCVLCIRHFEHFWAVALYRKRLAAVVQIAVEIRDEGAVFIIRDDFYPYKVLSFDQRRHTSV
jgi:hypothetical protein